MKPKIKNYEVIIAVIIIINVIVFTFFSRGLEGFVKTYADGIEVKSGM